MQTIPIDKAVAMIPGGAFGLNRETRKKLINRSMGVDLVEISGI